MDNIESRPRSPGFQALPVPRKPLSRRRLMQLGAGMPLAAFNASRSQAARQQPEAATFTLVTNRTPTDLDPHSAYDAGSGVPLQGPFEGLIRLKAGTNDDYEPVLAESWQANSDKSVWTFWLRDGVRFHDGTPLTAAIARASFERLITLGLAPSNVLGRFIASPDQISTPDARTLVFDLGQPQPLFEAAISAPYGTAIVNTQALRAHEVDGDWGQGWAQAGNDGLGTGPYRIARFEIETGVILERFERYWRGWSGQHFDRIVIRVVAEPETRRLLIETGDADLATTVPHAAIRALESQPQLVVDRRHNLAVTYIAMTMAGPLRSPTARQALCCAFPYDDVIDGVYEGFAKRAIGPVAELCRGFDPTTPVFQTDLDQARAQLRDAGVGEGTSLSMLVPSSNVDARAIAELFQTNLEAVGVHLDIQLTDFATYVGIVTGDMGAEERPNLLPSFWSPDYNDAWIHLWPQLSCTTWTSGNIGLYCNPRVEHLLEQAPLATDAAAYQAALNEVQHLVARDDPAAIYMAQPQWLTVLRRDVGGFAPHPVVGGIIDFYALYRRAT